MASYLGTQAQAVGVGRYYGGLLGRADRLVMIMVVGIIDLLVPLSFWGLSLLGWMLVLFGVFGHITAFQRFAYVWAKVE
jgi:archaetidylinositol phosphate synthase